MAKILGSKQGSKVRFSAYCNYHLLQLVKAVRNENIKRSNSSKVLQLPMRYSTSLLKSILSDLIVDGIWTSSEDKCHVADAKRQTKHCFELDCEDDFDLRLLERIGCRKSNSLDKLLIFWLWKCGNLSWYSHRFTCYADVYDLTANYSCFIAFHPRKPDIFFDEFMISAVGSWSGPPIDYSNSVARMLLPEKPKKITVIS